MCSLQITHNPFALTMQIVINCSEDEAANGFLAKHLLNVFKYLCKVDYATNKFIHAPTLSYNEVVHLLELAGCG